jgi:DNA-binding NarL/FixJ family response regulator
VALGGSAVPCVVVSDTIWLAEAITRSLELPCTGVLRLRQAAADLPHLLSVSRSPRLAIVVEPEGRALAPPVRVLRRRWPEIKVLVAGLPSKEDAILRAVAARVDGIVLAEESLDQLAEAMRVVLSGTFRSPPRLLRPLFNRLVGLSGVSDEEQPAITRLSAREVEVLGYIERGESNKAIAVQLFVEEQTVKNHVTQILRKLRVRTRYDAARIAADLRECRQREGA